MLISIVIGVWMLIAGILVGFGMGSGNNAKMAKEYGSTVVAIEMIMAILWPISIPLVYLLTRSSADEENIPIAKFFLAATDMDAMCSEDIDVHCFSDAVPAGGDECNCGMTTYCEDGYCKLVSYSEEVA